MNLLLLGVFTCRTLTAPLLYQAQGPGYLRGQRRRSHRNPSDNCWTDLGWEGRWAMQNTHERLTQGQCSGNKAGGDDVKMATVRKTARVMMWEGRSGGFQGTSLGSLSLRPEAPPIVQMV